MHEMALCEGVLQLLSEEAARQRFERVKTVWIEIGALSHVEPEALRFCFDVVTDGTLAHGARLEILRPDGKAWCIDCCASVALRARGEPCPTCGGYKLQVTDGDQMTVKELEVA